jgi:Rieske Fe-S protein
VNRDIDAGAAPGMTRRAILVAACGVLALGATATPAAANSNVRQLADGRLAVRVNRIPELARVGGAVKVGTVKGTPVAVVRVAEGYRAISLQCPHQGVLVKRDESGWVCPAHGSEFAATGALELGPATKGLGRVASSLKGGTLTVG